MDQAAGLSLRIATVILVVHDLEAVARFYRKVIGLELMTHDATTARLGTSSKVLVELRRDAAARRAGPREPGLFHTAFLLPTRADLGRWMRHAAAGSVRLQGASDHLVSEAIYLADPEGNGVEIYADRPRAEWRWHDGMVQMATDPLAVADLVARGGGLDWAGAPTGTTIGHVHLQVGAIPAAEAFYSGSLGLDVTCRYPGGTFYSVGGYHHQFATNIWNSRGAAPRVGPSTGLGEIVVEIDRATAARIATASRVEPDPGGLLVRDPWATALRLIPA